jgi:hypothetical protein
MKISVDAAISGLIILPRIASFWTRNLRNWSEWLFIRLADEESIGKMVIPLGITILCNLIQTGKTKMHPAIL